MIEKVVDILASLHDRVSSIEECLVPLTKAVNDLSSTIANPDGFLTFKGKTSTRAKEIQECVENSALLELDEVAIEARFSQAVYLGVRPEINQKLEEVIGKANLGQLESLLQKSKKLDATIAASEAAIQEMSACIDLAYARADINAQNVVDTKMSESVKVIESKLSEAQRSESRVDSALERVQLAIERADALTARANNVIAVSEKPNKGIFTVKKK